LIFGKEENAVNYSYGEKYKNKKLVKNRPPARKAVKKKKHGVGTEPVRSAFSFEVG